MAELPNPGVIETITGELDLEGFQSKYVGSYETDLGICPWTRSRNRKDMIVKASVNLHIRDDPKRIIAVCSATINSRGAHGYYDFYQPVLDKDGFLLMKFHIRSNVAGNTQGGKEEDRRRSFDPTIVEKWWNLADSLDYGSGCWYPN